MEGSITSSLKEIIVGRFFDLTDDYLGFTSILAHQKLKLPFYLYAYCLMPNHVHLQTETSSLNVNDVKPPLPCSLTIFTNFNNRLQPTQIDLGTSGTDSSVLKLDYGYGTTTNNGNVASQTITIGSTVMNQTYGYDALNRLSSASENSGVSWSQSNGFDRYGNRWVSGYVVPGNESRTPPSQSAFNAATNRINPAVMPGFGYDSAGNVTSDPTTPAQGIVYDAENRQVSYTKAGATTTYSYDGDGRRVKKVVGSVTTIFVYNASGQLIAEYTNDTTPPVGGGGTSYLTSDHLGSTRVVMKSDGTTVKARYDYLPFGEEIPSSVGGRSSVAGYGGGDSTKQKFTQKERDSESGLDYFGARYYGSTQGRFTSPDPVIISTRRMVNPQIWNLYSYVGNNPLSFVDPTGEELVRLGQHTDEQIDARRKAIDQEKKAARRDSSLTKAQQDEERGKLEAEKKTLGLEKEGNRVVGALLSALDSEGQRNGLALTDFTLSTDTKNDFQGYATPDAMKMLLNDQAFVIQNNRKFSGTIYVRTEPSYGFYQLSQTYPDFRYYGGGVVRHEQEHLLGRGEGPAYRVQDNVMHLFQKHFQNKDIYKTLDEALHDAIKKNP